MNISRLLNMKTLRLNKCILDIDYITEICQNCIHLIELHAQESCKRFPSNDQLLQIVRIAVNLENLSITNASAQHIISSDHFQQLTDNVANRNKKLSLSIIDSHPLSIIHILSNDIIDFKYSVREMRF